MLNGQTNAEYESQLQFVPPPPTQGGLELVRGAHQIARHEKRVAAQFEEKRVCTFLPLLRKSTSGATGRSKVEVPMFSCYAFVRIAQTQ